MILDREDIIETGKVYKFKTIPIDPTDLFRGKYIILNYEADEFQVGTKQGWEQRSEVFVRFGKDKEDFAKVLDVSYKRPVDSHDYVKAKLRYVSEIKGKFKLQLSYPFDRYYMEESKAPEAEKAHINAQRDSTLSTYALINIKDGEAVITNVMINDTPIKEFVREKEED